jgi:hypothetical protein
MNHDVYALGTLGWLLALGEYERPSYANTTDVSSIYDAASRRTFPDVDRIPQDVESCFGGFGNLLLDCWSEGISLSQMEQVIEDMLKQ